MDNYEQLSALFKKMPDSMKYDLVVDAFGKQKVVIEVINGEVKVLRQPDNVDVTIHTEPVKRCTSCKRHKYEVSALAECYDHPDELLCENCVYACFPCAKHFCSYASELHQMHKH